MNFHNIKLAIIVVLAFSLTLSAQTSIYDVYQHPTLNNLPVNDMMIDYDGVMYIGTEAGLFKLSEFDEMPSIVKPAGVIDLVMGENEVGWMATYDNKVGITTQTATYPTGIRANNIVTKIGIERNTIWIGTNDGLYSLPLKSKELTTYYNIGNSKILSNRIQDLYIDKNGTKWIATDNGLSIFKKGKWSTLLKNTNITAIEGHGRSLWIAGEGKLWCYKNMQELEEIALIEEFSSFPIQDMLFDNDGNFWIINNKLGKYNSDWIPSFFTEQHGFNSQQPICLAKDYQGSIWVGTAGQGLYQVRNKTSNKPPIYAFAEESSMDSTKSIIHTKIMYGSKIDETPIQVTSQFAGSRIIKAGKEVDIQDTEIQIAVWDAYIADGDTISLFYNGECILDRFDLKDERQLFKLKVNPSKANQLVLYAHNEGEVGSNTIKIALLHRDEPREWITLTSDSLRCDKVNFNYKKRKRKGKIFKRNGTK